MPPSHCMHRREGGASSRPALQHLILQRLRGLPSVVWGQISKMGNQEILQNGEIKKFCKTENQEILQNRKSSIYSSDIICDGNMMKSTISEFHKYPQCGYLEYPNRRVPQNNKTVMPIMQLSVEFFRKLEWPFLYTHCTPPPNHCAVHVFIR